MIYRDIRCDELFFQLITHRFYTIFLYFSDFGCPFLKLVDF